MIDLPLLNSFMTHSYNFFSLSKSLSIVEEVPQDVCKNHNGIPHKSKPVCCHNKCPECGGKNWKKFCKGKGTDKSGKKLGNKKCCGWRIEQEGKICGRNRSKAPCILEQY